MLSARIFLVGLFVLVIIDNGLWLCGLCVLWFIMLHGINSIFRNVLIKGRRTDLMHDDWIVICPQTFPVNYRPIITRLNPPFQNQSSSLPDFFKVDTLPDKKHYNKCIFIWFILPQYFLWALLGHQLMSNRSSWRFKYIFASFYGWTTKYILRSI